MSTSTLRFLAAGFFILAVLTSGCNSPTGDFVHKSEEQLAQMEQLSTEAHQHFVNGNYENAGIILDKLTSERTVSRPLYQLEKLSVLLLEGKNDEAHTLMQKLHADFEYLFDKKLEEKAQSVWHGEINKVFKGDAYERSTFYALMALSYINKGDCENALSCVKTGLLIDADSNSETAINDYALLYYLGHIAASKLQKKGDAGEYLRDMKKGLQTQGYKLSENPRTDCFSQIPRNTPNVLLVVWSGTPPTVVCTGKYKEIRNIIRGENVFDAMTVSVGSGRSVYIPNNLGDIEYQATTRGGRLMDNVLADKAAVKSAMEVSGNVFLVTGTALLLAGARTLGTPPVGISLLGAGLGCLVIGGTVHIVGAYMNPAADGRFWKNLPAQLHIVPLNLPPGKHTVMLKGESSGDTSGIAMYHVDVPAKESISVFHLPMLSQGFSYTAAIEAHRKNVLDEILPKANADRLAKEIK